MTRSIQWTEKHWRCIERLMKENGPMPWYAVSYQLTLSSSNITRTIADLVIREKIKNQTVEVVRRGSSRKGGNLYLRLPDRKPRLMSADDMRELRRQ